MLPRPRIRDGPNGDRREEYANRDYRGYKDDRDGYGRQADLDQMNYDNYGRSWSESSRDYAYLQDHAMGSVYEKESRRGDSRNDSRYNDAASFDGSYNTQGRSLRGGMDGGVPSLAGTETDTDSVAGSSVSGLSLSGMSNR